MTRDALDRNLIALLQANARESTANLARKLGLARTTVVARLARLEQGGVIVGYTLRLGADDARPQVRAFVGITLQPKTSRDVMSRLAQLPELLRTDATARLDALLDQIGAIDGVMKTTTSVELALRIDRGR